METTFSIGLLKGKTITSIEVIKAEHGRTYRHYTCFVCSDGTKLVVMDGCAKPYSPQFSIEEMKKAPNYFTTIDIAQRTLEIEKRKRQLKKEQKEHKRRQYEKLKTELNL